MRTVTAESILPNHSAHIKRTDKQNDVLKDWEEDDFRRLGLKEVEQKENRIEQREGRNSLRIEEQGLSQFDIINRKFRE